MQGLGAALQPAAQPAQPGAAPVADPAAASPGQEATPEEQALYDDFIGRAESILMPERGKVSPEIVANLRGDFDPQAAQVFASAEPPLAQSPQDAVSGTAVLLTMMIEAGAKQEGVDFPDDVVMHAGTEVVEMLIAVSEAAGIHEFDEGEEMEGILYRAMDLYRVVSPRIDQETLKAGFAQLMEANDAGKLNEVLPGLPGGAPLEGAPA